MKKALTILIILLSSESIGYAQTLTAASPNSDLIYYRFIQAPSSNLHLDASAGSDLFLNHYKGNNIKFGANGSWMIVTNQGKVGIGTTSLTGNYRLTIQEQASGSGYGLRILNANKSKSMQMWVGTGGGVIDAEGSTSLHIRTAGMDRLFINNGGNIGVGTTSPKGRLNVVGSGTIASNWANRNVSYLAITESNGKGIYFDSNEIQCWTEQGVGDNLYLQSSSTAGNTYLNGVAGNVGIGTHAPSYKLSVNGTIGAKEVKVNTSGWSDFVFDPDYKLPTLLEVETFINQNGHLPDIPSAEEVEANGISLGEMDAKLLQKIEELTLYVIELKKENEELKSRTSRIDQLELFINELIQSQK